MASAKKSAAKKTPTGPAKPPKKPAAKRMGRPPKPEGERKSASLLLRMTPEQKASLQRAADMQATDLSTFIVDAAIQRSYEISKK